MITRHNLSSQADELSAKQAKAGPKCVFVFGGPGIGKEKICAKVEKEFDFVCLSGAGGAEALQAEMARCVCVLWAEFDHLNLAAAAVYI